MVSSVLLPPPNSLEAEQAYLGSVMQANLLQTELTTEHFYAAPNRRIYENLASAIREGRPVEPIAFCDYLESRKVLDSVGGRPYITQLYAKVPSPVLADHYAQILKEKYLLRKVIDQCSELIRVAREAEVDVPDLLEQTQKTLTEIIVKSQQRFTIRHIKEGKDAAIKQLEHAFKHRGDQVQGGIATGFYDFDRMTTGLLPGQYVVLGARPSQGKTSLALNIAANVALTNQVPVGLFSLEMSYEQIWQRFLSFHARLSRQRWRDGFLGDHDMPEVKEKAGEIAGAKLWIDDTSGLTVEQFRSRARLMKLQYDVQMIVVDYLQIMKGSKVRGGQDPRIEVNEISATMKGVAKELGLVVVGCAQLNRQTEERDRIFGKPRSSDLKESGALEQDADCVALLWRPVMHLHGGAKQKAALAHELKLQDEEGNFLFTMDKEKPWKLAEKQELSEDQLRDRDELIERYAELIIVKQRDGPVGNIPLRFIKDQTRFVNVTQKEWSSNPQYQQPNFREEPPAKPKELPLGDIKEVFPNAEETPNGEHPF